ncbi:MAG: hypothetical protein AB2693_22480 [Candidatus Thiodiazotropha sp.]
MVIVNALIGHIQEGKAENAQKAIRQMLSPLPWSCAGRSRYPSMRKSWPFESEHRFMVILHQSHRGNAYIVLKDTAEQLLKR